MNSWTVSFVELLNMNRISSSLLGVCVLLQSRREDNVRVIQPKHVRSHWKGHNVILVG